jgi:hypothetical protein
MSKIITSVPTASACAATAAMAFVPTAFAGEPKECTDANGAIGPYGPAGGVPAVGN